ncbi:hypothetical protein WOLCODRAFT_168104 [Wolfiporia cocos MD-104 SS10]|uniref:Uncharacterized protein n=1 Tax=Wolfiporia cocos (strain MD-104) TaxID=742152 RepID=A0A2H3K6D4_WOLCO|nr:hypothetical protein WOLCODRAFT_168104 [Wolfiporia cocos MD-104 SS10]
MASGTARADMLAVLCLPRRPLSMHAAPRPLCYCYRRVASSDRPQRLPSVTPSRPPLPAPRPHWPRYIEVGVQHSPPGFGGARANSASLQWTTARILPAPRRQRDWNKYGVQLRPVGAIGDTVRPVLPADQWPHRAAHQPHLAALRMQTRARPSPRTPSDTDTYEVHELDATRAAGGAELGL